MDAPKTAEDLQLQSRAPSTLDEFKKRHSWRKVAPQRQLCHGCLYGITKKGSGIYFCIRYAGHIYQIEPVAICDEYTEPGTNGYHMRTVRSWGYQKVTRPKVHR